MSFAGDDIDALIAELDHTDKPIIRAAVDRLIALANDNPEARRRVEARLDESGYRTYWPAAYILGHLPQPSSRTLRALLEAFDHREPDIRWANALLITRIAKAEPAVIALLIELSERGSSNQKRMAAYCLRDLELVDSVSLAALAARLDDSDATVRVAAITSLKTRPDTDSETRQKLLECYRRDPDDRVRHAAAITLASYGAASRAFLEALEKARQSAHPQTKKAAEAALKLLKNK
jgi:hypothetical protein